MTTLVQRRTTEDLKRIATGIAVGTYFYAAPTDHERMQFAFGLATIPIVEKWVGEVGPDRARAAFSTVGLVFMDQTKAIHFTNEGIPVFQECEFVHANDMEALSELIEQVMDEARRFMQEHNFMCLNCGVSLRHYEHSFDSPGSCLLSARS